jgi:hypothetical protein
MPAAFVILFPMDYLRPREAPLYVGGVQIPETSQKYVIFRLKNNIRVPLKKEMLLTAVNNTG